MNRRLLEPALSTGAVIARLVFPSAFLVNNLHFLLQCVLGPGIIRACVELVRTGKIALNCVSLNLSENRTDKLKI